MDSSMSMTPSGNDDLPSSPPKRRKLKHPRTSRACNFCRRRKVRCTGTQPCDYCQGEGVRCEYDDGVARPQPRPVESHGVPPASPSAMGYPPPHRSPQQRFAEPGNASRPFPAPVVGISRNLSPQGPRRPSLDPPQTFAEGQHIGPTAGVSFLYHAWNNRNEAIEGEATLLPSAPLTCHGDAPQPKILQDLPLPTRDQSSALLERYFRFATPTYRFLHRPTLEKWMSQLLSGSGLSMAEAACALLVCSQSLLYTKEGNRYLDGGDEDLNRSRFYFEKAKSLLNQEPGPASIASVQARLAMCLYLLSTFRINESRFCFSLACTILISLGLHRRTPSGHKLDLVTLESRKRTFWCAYVMDDYLSVMLGRPRMLRDEDIDQPYPRNIDDQDLLSTESPEDLPLHGNLEAFIAHADMAKLMGRNSDLLYPIQALTEDQVLARTDEMLAAVFQWRDSLPDFLKPRDRTLTGQRTFERQNTVLKYAYAHLRILITRRCLLADFSRLGRSSKPSTTDDRAFVPIKECVRAISTILDASYDLSQRGAFYQAFWFTQYITLVAISTLYVFIIQHSRSHFPPSLFPEVDVFFDKAKHLQSLLTALAPEGSQAQRHWSLLDRLRARAEKDAARAKRPMTMGVAPTPVSTAAGVTVHESTSTSPSTPAHPQPQADNQNRRKNPLPPLERHSPAGGRGPLDLQSTALTATGTAMTVNGGHNNNNQDADRPHSSGDLGMILGQSQQFTPSEDDFIFQNLLGWGWENLDTVGFPGDGDMFGFEA